MTDAPAEAVETLTLAQAIAVLENRCAAIDQHYRRFPNTVERTMEETANAMRTVMAYARASQAERA